MTRFQKELSGQLGEFWKDNAEKELVRVKEMIETGKITIDEYGVARNHLGKVLMSDLLEKVKIVNNDVDVEATTEARDIEVSEFLSEYRKNYTGPSAEEIAEAKAAFEPGTKVVNILTGTSYIV